MNGTAVKGAAAKESAINGARVKGAAVSGAAMNGAPAKGSAVNGAAMNGAPVKGAAVSGSATSDGTVTLRALGWAACMALASAAACTGEDQPLDGSMEVTMAATEAETVPASSESSTVLLPVGTDPTISFSLSFGVGSQDDPPGKEGLAYITAKMLDDASTENRRYEAILEALYPIASSYGVRVDREVTTLIGRTHRDNIDLFFELYSDAYLRPAFDSDDFQRIRSDAVNYLENQLRFSSDEELGKAALYEFVFSGTPYAHPAVGTVEGLQSITLDDVRSFYRSHYQRRNATPGLGGGFDDELRERFQASLAGLPEVTPGDYVAVDPAIEPPALAGREVLLVSKPGADASISFGFPIDLSRGERDFYALWVANSWLGEHRNQASRLFEVIREDRGLNYGDYSYIEAFPDGGRLTMPPVNVPRRHQLFEVWIRTLPNHQAHFALRAAIRELEDLVDNGLTQEEFDLTRSFLTKYILHFAVNTSQRLGYAMDDRFYGIGGEGHLARFAQMLQELTLEDVNAAIREHLQYENLKIAIVTGDAEGLSAALAADAESSIEYAQEMPEAVLAEDEEISRLPLGISEDRINTVPVESMFQGGD